MKREFVIPMKPLSINASNSRDNRFKSTEYNNWFPLVLRQLSKTHNSKNLEDLREFFDPIKHYFVFDMVTYYPNDIFWTEECTVSAKTMDQSNVEKPIVDLIFLPKFHKAKKPYGAENINADDKFICDLHSYKRPTLGDDIIMVINIEICDLEKLNDIKI